MVSASTGKVRTTFAVPRSKGKLGRWQVLPFPPCLLTQTHSADFHRSNTHKLHGSAQKRNSTVTPVHIHGAGGLAVTAGGTSLCVWDMMAGGRLLQRLSQHQKTVTCVVLSPLAGPDSAAAPRMLSGSLDGHVKVCTPGCCTVHYYSVPLLCCASTCSASNMLCYRWAPSLVFGRADGG